MKKQENRTLREFTQENATHVLRKEPIVLAHNFSGLEAKFEKQVNGHLIQVTLRSK